MLFCFDPWKRRSFSIRHVYTFKYQGDPNLANYEKSCTFNENINHIAIYSSNLWHNYLKWTKIDGKKQKEKHETDQAQARKTKKKIKVLQRWNTWETNNWKLTNGRVKADRSKLPCLCALDWEVSAPYLHWKAYQLYNDKTYKLMLITYLFQCRVVMASGRKTKWGPEFYEIYMDKEMRKGWTELQVDKLN